MPCVGGKRTDCLAMTEPGAGSDIRAIPTRAVRNGDGWTIRGTKHFISHADQADFVILLARTGSDDAGRQTMSTFIVDLDAPGLNVHEDYRNVSHRGYTNSILDFDDVWIGDEALLGEEGEGLELAGEWLGSTRLSVAATCLGRAERALGLSTVHAANREQFGRTIGRFQGVGFKLADMATELRAAELVTLYAAWKLSQGTASDPDIAIAKGAGHRDARDGRRRGHPDPRRHGFDGRAAARADLAGRDVLHRRREDGVLEVTLDRPKANAIDLATSRAMGEVFAAFRDDPHVRNAILRTAGDKFFCAGWDLKAAAAGDAVDGDYGVGGFGGIQELPDLNKPVIAAVHGLAVGGGFELALSCDLVYASESTQFGLPEINAGTLADAATVKLPKRIPFTSPWSCSSPGAR